MIAIVCSLSQAECFSFSAVLSGFGEAANLSKTAQLESSAARPGALAICLQHLLFTAVLLLQRGSHPWSRIQLVIIY